MSLAEATSALKSRISGKEAVKAKVKFDLGTEGIVLVDGNMSPPEISNTDGDADVTLIMSHENFMKLLDGDLNPQMAFMTGKLKIEGNMGIAMQLSQMFS